MVIDENKVRAYLLRSIANNNKKIVAVMYNEAKSSRDSFNGGFNEIIGFFAGGMHGDAILRVFDAISNNPKKRYSAYNFFDIDTLIAYNSFLQDIVAEVDGFAVAGGRTMPTSRDFRNGLTNAKINLKENAGTEKSGYYDRNRPVKLAYKYVDGAKYLDPMKALSREAFAKKYNVLECQRELNKYIESKYAPKQTIEASPIEYFNYSANGVTYKLEVKSKEYYTDQQGKGLVSIVATSGDGTLYGTYYNDGSVYEGDLYDLEGEFIRANDGGETFFANNRKNNNELEFKDEECPQLTLFD